MAASSFARMPMVLAGLQQRQPTSRPLRETRLPMSRRRIVHLQPAFPGEDAPGTGSRAFPEEVPRSPRTPIRQEHFQMKSTQECYNEFPALVRASSPIFSEPSEELQQPSGVVVLQTPDMGPATGHRKRPEPIDPRGPLQPRLHHSERQEDLRREVASRKGC